MLMTYQMARPPTLRYLGRTKPPFIFAFFPTSSLSETKSVTRTYSRLSCTYTLCTQKKNQLVCEFDEISTFCARQNCIKNQLGRMTCKTRGLSPIFVMVCRMFGGTMNIALCAPILLSSSSTTSVSSRTSSKAIRIHPVITTYVHWVKQISAGRDLIGARNIH